MKHIKSTLLRLLGALGLTLGTTTVTSAVTETYVGRFQITSTQGGVAVGDIFTLTLTLNYDQLIDPGYGFADFGAMLSGEPTNTGTWNVSNLDYSGWPGMWDGGDAYTLHLTATGMGSLDPALNAIFVTWYSTPATIVPGLTAGATLDDLFVSGHLDPAEFYATEIMLAFGNGDGMASGSLVSASLVPETGASTLLALTILSATLWFRRRRA